MSVNIKMMNEKINEPKMMRAVYCEKLIEMAENDDRIVALDADLIGASGMAPFRARFPERMIECGIQEANMIGVAAGLAAVGKRPYAHSFAPFATRRCMDQITVSAGFGRLPVTIVGSDPGVSAAYNGGTHMPLEDMGAIMAIPEIVAVEPCDATQLKSILEEINRLEKSCYLRLYRKTPRRIYEEGSKFEIGKGVVCREGKDLTIIASGLMVAEALDAAEALEKENISARVVDMFTWKPVDSELIAKCASETGAIVTAENHNIYCGLGAVVAQEVSKSHPVPMEIVGIKDHFGEVGDEEFLKEKYHLKWSNIYNSALKVLSRKINGSDMFFIQG